MDEAVESPDRIEVMFFTQSHFKFALLLNYKLSIVYSVAYILLKQFFTIEIFKVMSEEHVHEIFHSNCHQNF